MAKLGDVCVSITDGSHNPPVGVEQSPFIMLSSKNIEDNYISLSSPRYLSESDYASENKRTQISAGDLLVTIVGTIGRVAIVPPALEGICVQRSVAVLKTNPDIIDNRFLMYQLQNMRPHLEREAKGVAQKGIYLKQLSSLTVSTPPMEEQKRIAAVLDKVTDLIAQRRTQLDKLDLLVKSRFVEMFGCYNGINEHPLHTLCNFIDYRGKTPTKSETGLPLITAKNVKKNSFSIEPQEFIPAENYDIVMTRGIPKINDVLFTTEAPLGNVCRIPSIYDKFCVGQRIITMQPHKDILTSEYLEFALSSKDFRDKIWQKSSGSTVKGIRSKLLEQLSIPVPPLEQQQQFSKLVSKVERCKTLINSSLDQLETLKKAKMYQYFEGENKSWVM